MPLLNYTTTIAVEKTLGEIVGLLAKAGARSITTDYDPQTRQPIAVEFVIETQFGDKDFALPANMDAVHQKLLLQNKRGQVAARFTSREQAARVGWRILKDWVEAQLAIIETGMVTLDQVMLPYMLVSANKTMYQALATSRLALPGPRRVESE